MTKLSRETLDQVRKEYNDEALFLLSDFPTKKVNSIPTGSLLLDDALGVGGIPRGRITELYGIESAGKTTLCQHIVANVHRQDELAAFIDVEHAIDIAYAEKCGVDLDRLYLAQPNFAEEALGVAEILIRSGEVGVIIIDSIASLSPEKEQEGEFEDKNVTGMLRAKMLNTFFRRTKNYLRKHDIALVLTNQMRDNTKSFFGGLKTTGGHGVKHYASVRISLWRDDAIKDSGREVGLKVDATVKKNKVARPFRKAKFAILEDYVIDVPTDILVASVELGIVKKRGPYYKLDGEVIGHGESNTISELRENLELRNKLEEICRDIIKERNT